MNAKLFPGVLLASAFFLSILSSEAHALSIAIFETEGVAVAGYGESERVGILNADGFIEYYIPLSQQASGVYGVNGVGTSSDLGGGGGDLSMFLAFTGDFNQSISNASLTFEFIDLDLAEVNDPAGFYETIQFHHEDGTSTEVIDSILDTSTEYEIAGNHVTQTINFPDASTLLDLSGDGPLVLSLQFTTHSLHYGYNTSEHLRATLTYQVEPQTEVPEPASMLLLGCGLGGLAFRKRKPLEA